MTRSFDYATPAVDQPAVCSNSDTQDDRDLPYVSTTDGARLPVSYDLRKSSGWLAQGCDTFVSPAACAVSNYAANLAPSELEDNSRLFLSYNAEAIQRGGSTSTRVLLKALKKHGLCRQADWPDIVANRDYKPAQATYGAANIPVPIKYYRVQQSRIELMKAIADGLPVLATLSVYQAFLSQRASNYASVPMPNMQAESCLGKMTGTVLGYDDVQQRFLLQTCLGLGFGINGCCWLPYAYILNSDLCRDLWVLQLK